MKKLLKIKNQIMMIKLVGLRNFLGPLGIKVRIRIPNPGSASAYKDTLVCL